MSKLFVNLVNYGLLNSWASFLDWIFDDKKFDGWSPNMLGRYIKKLKKLSDLGEENYKYGAIKNLSFPRRLTKQKIIVLSGRQGGEAKDWVRHIRNGIAHGKTRIIKEAEEFWIEIKDYNKSGNQSAYIYFPISYIFKTFKIYKEIENQKYTNGE